MKKIFALLIALLIIPFHVNAIETSFDDETCTLTVAGEETGHEAMVSLFEDESFRVLKTDTIVDGEFSVDFILSYDFENTFKVVVTNEDGNNKITKNDVVVPACYLANQEGGTTKELFDEEGNSIIINSDERSFNEGDFLMLKFIDEESIDYIIELMGDEEPETKQFLINVKNGILDKIGDNKLFLFVLDIYVRDENNTDVDFSNYEDGFTLNIAMSKEDYEKLKGLKFAVLDKDNYTFGDPIDYEYDEENEMLSINIKDLSSLVIYLDNEYEFLDNTGNQKYNLDKDDTVRFRINADLAKFVSLYFNNKKVSEDDMDLSDGSTVIVLKKSYLQSLSLGTYTVTANFVDGSATTTLTVVNNETNPGTSDNVIYYIGAFILSIIAFAGVVIFKKKKLN